MKESASHHLKHIRFKSLSASLKKFVKFDEKMIIFWRVEAIFDQIETNLQYAQAVLEKTT